MRPVPGLAVVAAVALLAVLVLAGTGPRFGGDWLDYANDVAGADAGAVDAVTLLEPGHLLWRPLGLAAMRARTWFPGGAAIVPPDRAAAQAALRSLAAVAFVLSAALVALLVTRAGVPPGGVVAWSLVFMSCQAVLNNGHVGTPYLPAEAALLAGMTAGWFAPPGGGRLRWMAAGLFLGCSALLWFPFILALPGGLVGMWLTSREGGRAAWRGPLLAGVVAALVGGAGLLTAALANGVQDLPEFLTWFGGASHGVSVQPQPAQVIAGIPRSVLYLGDELRQVKRLLLDDPFGALSVTDLLAMGSLWAVLLFYVLFAVSLRVAWVGERGRGVVTALALAALPVVGFGMLWAGGDQERYLPLFPFALLVLAAGSVPVRPRALAALAPMLLGVAIVANGRAYVRPAIQRLQAESTDRLACLDDLQIAEATLVIPNWHDGMVNFFRTYPGHPVASRARVPLVLVTPHAPNAPRWRQRFASRAIATLEAGRPVWIVESVLQREPPAWSNWVEGDDDRVRWEQFPQYFGRFTYEPGCPGLDGGFLRLADTPANIQLLQATGGAPQG